MSYQPKTGSRCTCKPGGQRDNCPQCEGTGMQIDFKAIRERTNNAEWNEFHRTRVTRGPHFIDPNDPRKRR